jgi:diguanylate cyclase (GGDEF)-like protein/PAS domain S-box-containing protein
MFDIIFEALRAVVAGAIFFLVLRERRRSEIGRIRGWGYITAGFGLFFFAALLDLTDNFPTLNRFFFVVAGNTPVEVFLEKVVGYLFGLLCLGWGLLKWIPGLIARSETVRRELQTERNRLANIDEATGYGTWEWNVRTGELIVNERWARIIGYTPAELAPITRDTWERFVHPDDLNEARENIRRHFEGETPLVMSEYRIRHKNGQWIWIRVRGKVIEWDSEGRPLRMYGAYRDITETKELEERIRKLAIRLQTVIEAAGHGTWEWDIPTGEFLIDERCAEIAGYSVAELVPPNMETIKRLIHPDDFEASRVVLNLQFEGITDHYVTEYRVRHKDGSWVWVRVRGRVIERDGEGRPLKMCGTYVDVTQKKMMEEHIRELAIRDPLTNIYNRRYIFDRLEEIGAEYLRRGRNFCVSIIDIDFFKNINDNYGHQAGDFVLREFCGLVASVIRPYDLLGRYGGEEFIIVSPSSVCAEAAGLIQRLLNMVHEKVFVFEGHEMRLTFSCGISSGSELAGDRFSIKAVIALADERLYAAKQGGRDRLVWPDKTGVGTAETGAAPD